MYRVTVSMADVILSCRCCIFLIFSAYTMFLMYRHRKKSSGERSGLRGGQGIGPPLPIQASENLSFKTSVTKQLKWGGAPSCIKITLLTVSCSKVSICGNKYCSNKTSQTNPVHLFWWFCTFFMNVRKYNRKISNVVRTVRNLLMVTNVSIWGWHVKGKYCCWWM